MSQTTAKRLIESAQIAASPAAYYSPSNCKAQIKKLTLTNTSNAPVTVSLFLMITGGTASDANTVTKTRTVPGSSATSTGTLELYEVEGHILEAGDVLAASASTAGVVNLMVSGIEIVG